MISSTLTTMVGFDMQGKTRVNTAGIKLKKDAATGCDVTVQVRHETAGRADAAYQKSGDKPHQVEGLQARNFATSIVVSTR